MEIFFCSHCQQSIPLKDIQSGVAELRRGKYLCATCREIVTPIREKRPNYAAMYLGIFLVGALAVVGYLIFQEDLFPEPPSATAPRGPDLRSVADTMDRIRTDLEGVENRMRARLDEGFRDFAERLSKQDGSLTVAMSRLDLLRDRLASDEGSADTLMLKGRIDGLGRELGSLKQKIDAVLAAVAAVEDRLEALRRAEPKAEPAAPPKPAPEVSEVNRWIAQLGDPVAGNRFRALTELARFKGPEVDAALIGRLKDEDYFIRRFVAEELGVRKTEAALSALVNLLDDEEESVREAAVIALRTITGKEFGFKSRATARERSRAVARWRNHVAGLTKKK